MRGNPHWGRICVPAGMLRMRVVVTVHFFAAARLEQLKLITLHTLFVRPDSIDGSAKGSTNDCSQRERYDLCDH